MVIVSAGLVVTTAPAPLVTCAESDTDPEAPAVNVIEFVVAPAVTVAPVTVHT